MKGKFLALSMVLSAFLITTVNAQNVNILPKKCQKALSKDLTRLPYYKAADDTPFSLFGSIGANFEKIPFTKFKRKFLNGVYPDLNNSGFVVEKGSYLVNFTGTFSKPSGNSAIIELAVQVGSEFHYVNTNIIDTSLDEIQILSTSQVLHFDKRTKISIVARNIVGSSFTTTVLQRNILITKLS